jgi:hypothetical protein
LTQLLQLLITWYTHYTITDMSHTIHGTLDHTVPGPHLALDTYAYKNKGKQ